MAHGMSRTIRLLFMNADRTGKMRTNGKWRRELMLRFQPDAFNQARIGMKRSSATSKAVSSSSGNGGGRGQGMALRPAMPANIGQPGFRLSMLQIALCSSLTSTGAAPYLPNKGLNLEGRWARPTKQTQPAHHGQAVPGRARRTRAAWVDEPHHQAEHRALRGRRACPCPGAKRSGGVCRVPRGRQAGSPRSLIHH